MAAGGVAQAATTLNVLYAYPGNYKKVQDEIAKGFEASHPDIKINYWTPATTYDEVVEKILRGNLTGDVPDVTYVGLNQVGLLADRNLSQPMDKFVSGQSGWDALGYFPPLVEAGRVNGKVYGLPYAISLAILYVNADLVAKAGVSMADFPRTWDGVADLGEKIAALDERPSGFAYMFDGGGNFMFQSLLNGYGGTFGNAQACKLSFDSPQILQSFKTLENFRTKHAMELKWQQARPAFFAGKLGIYAATSSFVAQAATSIGDKFKFVTLPVPVDADVGKVPAGGSAAVMLAKTDASQKAAWEFIKYSTGPEAQAVVTKGTGYSPISKVASETPALLGDFFKQNPNHNAALSELSAASAWQTWPGPNGNKITDVIANGLEQLAEGKIAPTDLGGELKNDVKALLPACR